MRKTDESTMDVIEEHVYRRNNGFLSTIYKNMTNQMIITPLGTLELFSL